MEKIIKRSPLGLLTMLLLVCHLSTVAKPQEQIKTKEITQSYDVNPNDRLQVDNLFGNITITHWSKNEVAIRVEIRSEAGNERIAQANLDRVRVDTRKQAGVIAAVTTIDERKGNSSNESLTINYYIQMPSKLAARLSQKYGNINLPEKNDGETSVWVKYGNLNAGDFSGELAVDAKYGNIKVGHLRDATFYLGYAGNVQIGDTRELKVESKYSNLKIKDVHSLNMSAKYGDCSIESADRLNMEIKYSGLTVGRLNEELLVSDLSYSNIKIEDLSASFTQIKVDSHYGNLKIDAPASAAFKVVAKNMKYATCGVGGFKKIDKRVNEETHDFTCEINGGGSSSIYFNGNKYGNLSLNGK